MNLFEWKNLRYKNACAQDIQKAMADILDSIPREIALLH